MHSLDLKIPPPVIFILCVVFQGIFFFLFPDWTMENPLHLYFFAFLAILSLFFGISSVRIIRKAKTTLSPLTPEKTAVLVTHGIYRYTRNPMYLSLFLALLAIAAFLSHPAAMIISFLLPFYLTLFQIKPEETLLREKFGQKYQLYCKKVRRW